MLQRNLKVVEEDLMEVGNFGKKVLANTAGVYAVSMLPDFLTNTGPLTRSVNRGFLWYLSDELANEVLTMNSNFRNFADSKTMMTGVKNAVDDTAFYALASYAVEQTRVDVPVVNTVRGFIGNPTLAENLSLGLILTTSQLAAQSLEKAGWDAITNVTKKLGF